MKIVWIAYLKYRAEIRGFDSAEIERIIRSAKNDIPTPLPVG